MVVMVIGLLVVIGVLGGLEVRKELRKGRENWLRERMG